MTSLKLILVFYLSDPVVITGHPSNDSVTPNEEASFTCTAAANRGDLTIKWEVDSVLYDGENCNFCSLMVTNNGNGIKSSTLIINTRNIIMSQVTNVTYLSIVCIVNQTIVGSLDEARAIEVRSESRLERSNMAQLIIFSIPTTQPLSTTGLGVQYYSKIYNIISTLFLILSEITTNFMSIQS